MTIFYLYYDALSCRAPATNYALFLTEWYLLLKIKAVREGKPKNFKAIEEFFHCFNDLDEQVQCLLCELYMHNFFLEEDMDNNPSPFTGDVQFHAFLSFAKNYIRWAKAYNIFQKR